jgi:hypothetical protein
MSAIEVVQRQLDAYNAHDLAGFIAAYSDAVEVFIATVWFFDPD